MKEIRLDGITYLEKVEFGDDWYWGTNYLYGDLYEAEELYRDNSEIESNRLVFVHYPDGEVFEPVKPEKNKYFGRPLFNDGKLIILLVDFAKEKIILDSYTYPENKLEKITEISLDKVKDCYNLMLVGEKLTLCRQGFDGCFDIIWPENISFTVGNNESLLFREGDKLYFEDWCEYGNNEIYETVIRDLYSGEIIKKLPGTVMVMPDKSKWHLY